VGLAARRGPSKGAVILSVIRTARDRVARSVTNAARSAARTRPGAPARGSEFWTRVRKADADRDAHRWHEAEIGYEAALALEPHWGGYWVQHGHMLKEQGRNAEAETSYRTACAIGGAPEDVLDHLRFVLQQQGVDEGSFPIRFRKDAATGADQLPTRPTITALARLVWHVGALEAEELLGLMRNCATLDQVLARMIADPRFERANWNWLELVQEGEL